VGAFSRFLEPPRLRTLDSGDDRRATWLELFFDLVFVAAVTERFRDLYRRRAAVEREFATLKTHHGLTPLRVRGIERVRLHADLTILGRLSVALLRSRGVALAA
jgi:hypothetical protein